MDGTGGMEGAEHFFLARAGEWLISVQSLARSRFLYALYPPLDAVPYFYLWNGRLVWDLRGEGHILGFFGGTQHTRVLAPG